MLFEFLKYLQPTHYFQLHTKSGASIFPIAEALPAQILNRLEEDNNYLTKEARAYDISWQAVQLGYIGDTATYSVFKSVSVQDNYLFLRKNFHTAWVLFVLLLRLFSCHNPIKELKAWNRTRDLIKGKKRKEPITYPDWDHFESELIRQNHKVSVIIPTLNRYEYLKDILTDLEKQDYRNFEVIVVDQSEPFNQAFYDNYNLDINLIKQEEKALWLARNTAVKHSKGRFVALSEDDVRIQPNWISTHLKCLDFFDAQVSAGVFYPQGGKIPENRSFFSIATQFATGNAMLYKDVFKTVGLFDRQFEKQRMGDGEFGLRVYLEGVKSISNPIASCVDVKAGTGGLREMGSWDAFRPSAFFAPRPIPSVVYYFRKYFGDTSAKLALLRMVPLSVFPYQFKKNKPLLVLGVFLTVLIFPLVSYQVYKSWTLGSKKLEEGAKIESLEASKLEM